MTQGETTPSGRTDRRTPFEGVVLTGGQSRRMGTDKARLVIDGTALAVRTADALREAGADTVLCVGGATEALAELGLVAVPDVIPDQGPLGGLLTAFEATSADVVVMLACDMPLIGSSEITRIVEALAGSASAAVAAPRISGRWQFLTAAWRRDLAHETLRRRYDEGERSVRRVVAASLEAVEASLDRPERVEDADTPEDLRRLLRRGE